MALINIEGAIKKALASLKKLDPPQGIEILTYKRNRGVSIIKMDDGMFEVRERGYHEETQEVAEENLVRILKKITKREFPRSRKVRVYAVNSPGDLGRELKKL